jgi:hypothetical protein
MENQPKYSGEIDATRWRKSKDDLLKSKSTGGKINGSEFYAWLLAINSSI